MKLMLGALVLAALAAAGVAPAQEDVPTRDCRSRIESGRGPLAFPANGVVAGRSRSRACSAWLNGCLHAQTTGASS